MSTATMTRPAARPTSFGYAGSGAPVRAVRPLAAGPLVAAPLAARPLAVPGPLALGRRVPQPVAARRTRLTRRGRLVLLLLAVGILLASISVGRAGSQAATATETGPALTQTTVQQGETLWAVAQRIAPGNDPREVIAQIRRINHLPSSSLRAGQQLLLPVPTR
jgi:hypothetical protein